MVATLPLILFPFCLIAAALNDMREFKIPNELSLILIAGFAGAALLTGMDLQALGNHALTALIVLLVGFTLFCTNVFGAGDVKLLTVIALWLGWPSFLPCLIYIALFGGVLSVGIWGARFLARAFPSFSMKYTSLTTLAATERLKAPYGVAICIGTLLAFNQSPLFNALFAQIG